MKPSIFIILLVLIHLPLQTAGYYGEDTFATYSGSWYNPDQDGHGIHVEVIDEERTIIYWFSYDLYGQPLWLLMDGMNRSKGVYGSIYIFRGMKFGVFNPEDNIRDWWGTGWMEFYGCDRANFTWSPVLPGYSDGSIPLERLSNIATLDCNPLTDGLTGEWGIWNLASGQAQPYQTTVENDGRYYFFDDEGCRWDGQIARSLQDSNELVGKTGRTECTATNPEITPMKETSGLLRSTPYEVCETPETCGDYAPTMHLVTEWQEGEPDGPRLQELVFIRLSDEGKVDVEGLTGNWQLSFGISAPELVFNTSVDEHGVFSFVDGLGCTWFGRLEWWNKSAGTVESVLGKPLEDICPLTVPDFRLIGTFGAPTDFCTSGGVCELRDEGMWLSGTASSYDADGNIVEESYQLDLQWGRPSTP